jgi:hypothetical protein
MASGRKLRAAAPPFTSTPLALTRPVDTSFIGNNFSELRRGGGGYWRRQEQPTKGPT